MSEDRTKKLAEFFVELAKKDSDITSNVIAALSKKKENM
jgi:hypothetical protein